MELVIKIDEELLDQIPNARKELILKRFIQEIDSVLTNYKLEESHDWNLFSDNKRIRDLYQSIEIKE